MVDYGMWSSMSFQGDPRPTVECKVQRRARVAEFMADLPRMSSAVSINLKPHISLAGPQWSLLTPQGSTAAVRGSAAGDSDISLKIPIARESAESMSFFGDLSTKAVTEESSEGAEKKSSTESGVNEN